MIMIILMVFRYEHDRKIYSQPECLKYQKYYPQRLQPQCLTFNKMTVPFYFEGGPIRLPFCLNYLLILFQNYKYVYETIGKMTKRYNSKIIGYYFSNIPLVAVCDHDSIKEVLFRPEFQGRYDNIMLADRAYGKKLGIFFVDGPYWHEQRRFALRHMRDFGFGRRAAPLELEIHAELQDLIDLIKGNRKDEEVIRSDGAVRLPFALDPVFINALLVIYVGSRFPRSEDALLRTIGRNAMLLQKSGDSTGGLLTMYSWLKWLSPKLSGYYDGIRGSNILRKFLESAVVDQEKSYCDDHMRHFVDVYMSELKKLEKDGLPSTFSNEQLVITLMDFIVPTSSALSTTLAFALISASHYPEIQRKIQRELDEIVGRGRLPTLDDRQRLPYTEAVLRESMRQRTLAPLSVPHKVLEDTYLKGYFIPKGSLLLTILSCMHMDKDLWGDPEVFRPERFLDENGKINKKDYSLPFGAGKRLCAGETFARQNLFLVFSALLQNFTISNGKGCDIPHPDVRIPGVIETPPPFWAQFIPR